MAENGDMYLGDFASLTYMTMALQLGILMRGLHKLGKTRLDVLFDLFIYHAFQPNKRVYRSECL